MRQKCNICGEYKKCNEEGECPDCIQDSYDLEDWLPEDDDSEEDEVE
jgi:ABC-type ATPase with predicted acetyltransferase domain